MDKKENGNYCAYLRKSRAEQDAEMLGEWETLERQRGILSEFAEKSGIHISQLYKEVV